MINLSGMNFRENIKAIQWPLAKSKSLQSIHLSDNNIPKAIEINMLMCFGVKNTDESAETSIAGKLDPRLLKKTAMTNFQIKVQQNIERKKTINKKEAAIEGIDTVMMDSLNPTIINSYDDATAKIANAVELRDSLKSTY